MFEAINHYLSFQGRQYSKPERAGDRAEVMEAFKKSGQAARLEMTSLSQAIAGHLPDFRMGRVSSWLNQAQIARPHFWTYFHALADKPDDVGMAIRLYGREDDFGLSVEVSFIERHRSESTLTKQARVLDIPIKAPLYYWVQKEGESYREEGTEKNRQRLKAALANGDIRKVLIKTDIPISFDMTTEELVASILERFQLLYPYYLETKDEPMPSPLLTN